jgi:hypothetical protein
VAALLVLIGIICAGVAGPVLLFKEYRRLLLESRRDAELPEAAVVGVRASLVRSGVQARRHRLALRAALYRRLVPAWAIGLVLMLLGVYLA